MCSCIVGVNTTSDRLIIEQLEHEITQREGKRQEKDVRKSLWDVEGDIKKGG